MSCLDKVVTPGNNSLPLVDLGWIRELTILTLVQFKESLCRNFRTALDCQALDAFMSMRMTRSSDTNRIRIQLI